MSSKFTNYSQIVGEKIIQRPRRILTVLSVVIVLFVPLAIQTLRNLDANLLNQVSDKLPRFKALKDVTTDFGGDILVAVLSIPSNAASDTNCVNDLKRFADVFKLELESVGSHPDDQLTLKQASVPELPGPWLHQVQCRIGDIGSEIISILREYPQLAMTEDDIAEISRRFDTDSLHTRMQSLKEQLADLPSNSAERIKLLRDPLNLAELAQKRLKAHALNNPLQLESGDYLLSKDRTSLLVLCRPARSSNNVAFNRILMQACQRAENRAVVSFRRENIHSLLTTSLRSNELGCYALGESPSPALSIGFTGLHALSVENEKSLRKDIIEGSLEAFAALVLICLVFYRSLRLTLDVTLTLILAAILTVGVYGCVHGKIGVLGAGFTSILIGTGVDYGIMVYGTFRRFRLQGLHADAAVRETLASRGPGLLLACFTSVVGFLGLIIVDFQAIAEFGLLTGIGLAASAILMATLFPLLLLRHGDANFAKPTPLGLRKLGTALSTRSGRMVAIALGILIAGVCSALIIFQPPLEQGMERFLGVRFDPDIGNMRNRSAAASVLRDRIVEKFGRGFADIRVIVESAEENQAWNSSESVKQRLGPYLSAGMLQPGGSIVEFLSGFQDQKTVLGKLSQLDLRQLSRHFSTAAETEFGAAAQRAFAPFTASMEELSAKVSAARILSLEELLQSRFGSLLVPYARIDTQKGKKNVRLVSYFFPKDLQYSEEWLREVADSVERQQPQGCTIRLTAARFVGFELKRSVIHDMQWIFAVVAVVVAAIVWYPLKSIRQSLISTIPLCFAFLFVLAGIALSERLGGNLSLNYISLMIFPILMGSAVDYGIYMVLDLSSGRFSSISDVLEETGHSLVLCCGTTLGGYGSMILGSNSGMISFGWVALLGYSGALFAALVIVPVFTREHPCSHSSVASALADTSAYPVTSDR